MDGIPNNLVASTYELKEKHYRNMRRIIDLSDRQALNMSAAMRMRCCSEKGSELVYN